MQVKLGQVEEDAKHTLDEARSKLSGYEKELEGVTFEDKLREYRQGHAELKKDSNVVEFREGRQLEAGARVLDASEEDAVDLIP
jgi:hypothetical protein